MMLPQAPSLEQILQREHRDHPSAVVSAALSAIALADGASAKDDGGTPPDSDR